MLLNEKSKRILNVLLHDQHVSLPLLTMMLPYSKRTIDYELERIQEWLTFNRLPELSFEGNDIRVQQVEQLTKALDQAELVWSEEERELLILLYALTKREFLSAFHFQQLLGVSKFTTQESLNAVKHRAAKFGIDFAYTRKSGYHFNGHLHTIHLFLFRMIDRLVELSTKDALIQCILPDWKIRYEMIRQQIEAYEIAQQCQFVENYREKLITFLLFGSMMDSSSEYGEDETSYTGTVNQVITDFFKEYDALWTTLDLLIQSGPKVEEEMNEVLQHHLSTIMMEVIRRFETLSCTFIVEREALCEKLTLHSKATMQRVYSKIESSKELEHYVMSEHQVLNLLVERSLEPFEERMEEKLPSVEVMYYTLHFAAHLHQQGQRLDDKMKAIVVCPSGISVSHMLDNILKNQFPEFVFLPPISQRDVERYAPLVDLIFTTVPLPRSVHGLTDVMLVPTLPTRLEQVMLKRQIGQRFLNRTEHEQVRLEDVMQLIRTHSTIVNERLLKQELRTLLYGTQPSMQKGGQPVLNELITREKIQLATHVTDWQEAIRLAAKPLEAHGFIHTSYIDTMIENVKEHGPYVVLMPDVAIPHARPEDGVHQLGMSVLKLEEAVVFPEDKTVKVFFVLAAIDQTTHLKALAQLTELLGNAADLEKIQTAATIDEIVTVINKYSEEE